VSGLVESRASTWFFSSSTPPASSTGKWMLISDSLPPSSLVDGTRALLWVSDTSFGAYFMEAMKPLNEDIRIFRIYSRLIDRARILRFHFWMSLEEVYMPIDTNGILHIFIP
jgi:hypothetical protein